MVRLTGRQPTKALKRSGEKVVSFITLLSENLLEMKVLGFLLWLKGNLGMAKLF
jgi:hypothetical protein